MKFLVRSVVLAAALTMVAGAANAQNMPIAVVGPITGSNAALGEQMKRGAEMAVADINAKGGVLGLGKAFRPANATTQTAFTPLDTDQETVIRTSATKPEKAKLLSAQPAGSYEMVVVDGHVELHILDPKEFRKIRQVVILTA